MKRLPPPPAETRPKAKSKISVPEDVKKEGMQKDAVPEPTRPPSWKEASSSSQPENPGELVTDKGLTMSHLDYLVQSVKTALDENGTDFSNHGDAGWYHGIWMEPDNWDEGLWWKWLPGKGWVRWREHKATLLLFVTFYFVFSTTQSKLEHKIWFNTFVHHFFNWIHFRLVKQTKAKEVGATK